MYFKSRNFNCDACRHEDGVGGGVPDVSYGGLGVNGWVELKAYDDFPKRSNTIVQYKNFTVLQRRFLRNRGRAGGSCFVLTVVGRRVLIHDWSQLESLGSTNATQLMDLARYNYTLPLRAPQLTRLLFHKTTSHS